MSGTKSWGEMKRIREEPKPCRHCGQVEHERSCVAELKRTLEHVQRSEADTVKLMQEKVEAAETEAEQEIESLQKGVAAMGADRDAAEGEVRALREKLGMSGAVVEGVIPDPTDPSKSANEAMRDHMDFANAVAEDINEAFEKKGS